MTEIWTVPGALDGERVDRALALLTGLSRSAVDALVEGGRVTVGRTVVASRSRRVHAGERVRVAGALPPAGPPAPTADAGVDVPVVWSDEEVIVVDKPAGLVVHPGAAHVAGTLVNGLLARFPDLAGLAGREEQADRPGIVHRLDKGTSGLLVVARTARARDSLVAQLSRRSVGREYVALVHGSVQSDAGLIDAPVGRSDTEPTRMRVQAGGRQARTRYRVEERFELPPPATLLRCQLETGRTHQVRVHLASIGHPVVGDDRYGPRQMGRWQPLPAGRPFLHAAVLSFDHPRTGERLSFSSRIPLDLRNVLEWYRARPE